MKPAVDSIPKCKAYDFYKYEKTQSGVSKKDQTEDFPVGSLPPKIPRDPQRRLWQQPFCLLRLVNANSRVLLVWSRLKCSRKQYENDERQL